MARKIIDKSKLLILATRTLHPAKKLALLFLLTVVVLNLHTLYSEYHKEQKQKQLASEQTSKPAVPTP